MTTISQPRPVHRPPGRVLLGLGVGLVLVPLGAMADPLPSWQ